MPITIIYVNNWSLSDFLKGDRKDLIFDLKYKQRGVVRKKCGFSFEVPFFSKIEVSTFCDCRCFEK